MRPVGDVFLLLWVEGVDRDHLRPADPVRRDQGEVRPALPIEPEVGVQFASDDRAVFPGSENHQEVAGLQDQPVRQSPPGGVDRVVGEIPAPDLDRIAGRIPEFQPVGGVVVLIEQGGIVRCHELVDQDPVEGWETGNVVCIEGIGTRSDFVGITEGVPIGVGEGRIRTVDANLPPVVQPVVIGVGVSRISGRLSVDFLAIIEAVTIGVAKERIGIVDVEFVPVAQFVAVGVDESGIRSDIEFLDVGESVPVRVIVVTLGEVGEKAQLPGVRQGVVVSGTGPVDPLLEGEKVDFHGRQLGG